MRFPPSILDEIKMRLPVTAVVGKRVRLIKAGREWKGLSPFNAEKTPSFFVNDDKQRYFDFSSGKNGDIFTFVMETEGLSFNEAVERLAAEAGIALPQLTADDARREERRQGLHEALELAAAFFEAELGGSRGGRARAYLDGRELGPDVRSRFRLGYAPADRFALRDYLASKGFGREPMIDAGLLVSGDDIAVPYDRFRDRVMFPIADARGRIVAFGGRAMAADVQPKYLNSPETPLFHKGSLLYNFHQARKTARGGPVSSGPADTAAIVVVEGYVDVIAMTRAGLPQAVAPLGTALTQEQLGLLWRAADAPTLCFDGDRAGRRAAYRAIDLALPLLTPGKSVNFALLPEGQDPDDLLRDGGAAAVRAVVAAARPLVELLWAREAEATPLDTPDQRAALEHRVREIINSIQDETVRRHYRAEMNGRIAALIPDSRGPTRRSGYNQGRAGRDSRPAAGGFRRGLGTSVGAGAPLRASAALSRHPLFLRTKPADEPREALILLVLLAHPRLLARHCEELAEIEFTGAETRKLAAQLIDCAASHHDEGGPDPADGLAERLRAQVRRAGLEDALTRLRLLLRPGDTWALDPEADPADAEEMLRQVMVLHRRAGALNSELRAAERALAEDESEANLAWLRDVKMQLTSLEGTEADIDGFGHHGHLRI
ncbi:DNA primase [Chelatococcus reniformis]|uniref:DNA primase n=1 Tax=Chelatococcus reniformis TaxID=1494448 RepID=A0A916UPX2_9HYPH|nr:DNA primase [Chelatococcus reniformis]GGC82534.1 DNA primase [Chelatococcus reniformis]